MDRSTLSLLLLAAALAPGCSRTRFLSRQPIALSAEASEVGCGGRLVLQATRLGQRDPALKWAVVAGPGGVVLPGGVFLAPSQPGQVRIRVWDPRSGERAETTLQVVLEPGMPGEATFTELYDPGRVTTQAVGRLRTGRIHHAACLLGDGRVLVSGGRARFGGPALGTVELFDPAQGTWTPRLAQGLPRTGHTLTPLPDGSALVLGGDQPVAERYLPGEDRFQTLGVCGAGAGSHQTLSLRDGRVLVVGRTVELFDPKAGRFQSLPVNLEGWEAMSLTELTDGRVVLAGGLKGYEPVATMAVLDPSDGTLAVKGALSRGRAWPVAHLQPGYRLLVYGGTPAPGAAGDAVEEVDLEAWSARPGPPMETGVAGFAGVKLEDGRWVALGYRDGVAGGRTASVLIPMAHQVVPLRELQMGRVGHTLTLLPDGRILVVGGMERPEAAERSRTGARP